MHAAIEEVFVDPGLNRAVRRFLGQHPRNQHGRPQNAIEAGEAKELLQVPAQASIVCQRAEQQKKHGAAGCERSNLEPALCRSVVPQGHAQLPFDQRQASHSMAGVKPGEAEQSSLERFSSTLNRLTSFQHFPFSEGPFAPWNL